MSSKDPGGGRPPEPTMVPGGRKPPDKKGTAKEKHEVTRTAGTHENIIMSSQDSIVPETPEEVWEAQFDAEGEEEWGAETEDLPQQSGRDSLDFEDPEEKAPIPSDEDSEEKNDLTDHQEPESEEQVEDMEIKPEEIFDAVVQEMKNAQDGPPRESWKKTIAELFAVAHATVKIKVDLVPANKQRYPKPKGEEQGVLYQLFEEISVVGHGRYEDWQKTVVTVIHELYNTNWSFKNIIRSTVSKLKWSRLPVLNQRSSNRSKNNTTEEDEGQQRNAATQYEQIMFQPGKYPKEDMDRFRAICKQPAVAIEGRRLRLGSDDEWKIMKGLQEGTIVCRQLPEFIKSVLGRIERLRFYNTIQKQVEGELVMKLKNGMSVNMSRQSTRAIKEDILMAAERSKTNMQEIYQMLNLAKNISYNHAKRTVHFFFFDRATASKFALAVIPYKGQIHRVRNAHGPDARSIWQRQLDRYGVRTADRTTYAVKMYNITRFMDIGRLTAYLQKNIALELEMEDMDVCTPNSKSSTIWKLTIKSVACPEFLRGVVRIVWSGMIIILKHPSVGNRLQCLRCGNIGHVIARCEYTFDQLQGHGSRVAKDHEVAQLEDLAKLFASLDELKKSADMRFQLQQDREQQAQAAVMPTATTNTESREKMNERGTKSRQTMEADKVSTSHQKTKVTPKPKREWVTVQLAGGRKLYGHQPTLQQKNLKTASRYEALAEDSDQKDGKDWNEAVDKEDKPVIEISSGSSQEESKQEQLSNADKAKLHLVAKKPTEIPSIPMLLTLKQRERAALSKTMQIMREHSAGYAILEKARTVSTEGFNDLTTNLGLQEVNTPSSGNCMAMALAQAVANHDMSAQDVPFEEATACIKRGIKITGQMNLEQQFNHYTRMNTLINVSRGWKGMTAKESKKQFRWFLEEYAATPSSREAFVDKHNWGCSELMALAASFLQRSIFVMAYNVKGTSEWNCSLYKPSTVSSGHTVFESGQQIMLTIHECVTALRGGKCKKHLQPLVLRFWGNHYSAFTHLLGTTRAADASEDQSHASDEKAEQEDPPDD